MLVNCEADVPDGGTARPQALPVSVTSVEVGESETNTAAEFGEKYF